MQHVFVLEDDPELRLEIVETLSDEFLVDGYGTIHAFLQAFRNSDPQLVILDLGLPDGRGGDVIRSIREISNVVGILVLSGQKSEVERVVSLELGADDFLVKPCSPRELLARAHAILRRVVTSQPDKSRQQIAQFEGFSVDMFSMETVDKSGNPLPLTTAEFELLRVLVRHPQKVLSREQLLGHLRGDGWAGYDRSIDSLVYRLRKKLKSSKGEAQLLKTVHGSGYIFTPEVTFHQ